MSHGSSADTCENANTQHFPVNLTFSFPYFQKLFTSLDIHANGHIVFTDTKTNSSDYIIAPFEFDLSSAEFGSICYRSSFAGTEKATVEAEINSAFNMIWPNPTAYISKVFIITWSFVKKDCVLCSNRTATFQLILSFDYLTIHKSYLTLNFGLLEFNATDSYLQYLNSNNIIKNSIIDPGNSSNIHKSGKWIFCLGEGFLFNLVSYTLAKLFTLFFYRTHLYYLFSYKRKI